MGRRGKHTPRVIPGDPQDGQGFPVMVVEFCEHLAIRGYAPTSVKNQRTALALLADWLIERGVTRPCEVTKPMLDAYQRAVFYMRKADGQPLSFRIPGSAADPGPVLLSLAGADEPHPLQPRL